MHCEAEMINDMKSFNFQVLKGLRSLKIYNGWNSLRLGQRGVVKCGVNPGDVDDVPVRRPSR